VLLGGGGLRYSPHPLYLGPKVSRNIRLGAVDLPGLRFGFGFAEVLCSAHDFSIYPSFKDIVPVKRFGGKVGTKL